MKKELYVGKRKELPQGCHILSPTASENYSRQRDIIQLDMDDLFVIVRFRFEAYIRIESVITTGRDRFRRLMDDTLGLAEKDGINYLYYSGDMDLELLDCFLEYGFMEKGPRTGPHQFVELHC